MHNLIKIISCYLIFSFHINAEINGNRIVLITESTQPEMVGWFNDSVNFVMNTNSALANLQTSIIPYYRDKEADSYANLCKSLAEGVSLILDATWAPWGRVERLAEGWNIPHVSVNIGGSATILDGLLQFLHGRGASDVVMIFETEQVLEQSLYRILGTTLLRIMAVADIRIQINKLKLLRPIPGYFVLMGSTGFLADSYKLAVLEGLVYLPDRWVLCSTDLKAHKLDVSILKEKTFLVSMTTATSCDLQGASESCSDDDERFKVEIVLLNNIMKIITHILLLLETKNYQEIKPKCNAELSVINGTGPLAEFPNSIYESLRQQTSGHNESLLYFNKKRNTLYHRAELVVQVNTISGLSSVAQWFSNESIPKINIPTPRRYFKIGTATSVPWTYPKVDIKTGKPLITSKGQVIYEGYCIDLITKLAEIIDFDYEIVSPRSGSFGTKYPNGTWDGLIGDLVDGEIDFAVGALIMTSQREEVVDFIAPYFDQSGFTIVIRKPARKTSLFKFMTVLRVEVWLSIVAALTLTAILLAILDVHSPYSARNNKDVFSQYSREFTIKESLWFNLTSFTPQGGGEAPKSLSGRTLVAAYWLFVVLMLATFTANLAAFLTVERLQTPVSSLEQLARQSRINYTVVEDSPAHHYFLNMKNAEDILYRVWREITMNASSDELQYQVWDYPIREQYGHIVLAINGSQPVASAAEGFRKVDASEESDFAFIHDSAEIKYETSRNCNLTMVGDVFGERPYAIAIQQGSRIQEELAQALLQMQKSRYLDDLTAKYWNNTCIDADDSEGITLDSLGGVFIATLFGLALAMVTLVWEIFYYKRKERKVQKFTEDSSKANKYPKRPIKDVLRRVMKRDANTLKVARSVTIGNSFKPVRSIKKPKIQFIQVEPIHELKFHP